jgi:imidazolonepropionase-like amidohydrolase
MRFFGNIEHRTSNAERRMTVVRPSGHWMFGVRCSMFDVFPFLVVWFLAVLCVVVPIHAETLLLENAIVHTVSGDTIASGSVLIENGKISNVSGTGARLNLPPGTRRIDLKGQHLYPGLIALNSALGLTEIQSVRATRDERDVGDYTPDLESWIAVNPDSELIPVTRANGIAYFEPAPDGSVIPGQSALMSMDGWTMEQMVVRKPAALHLFWPAMQLDTTPPRGRRGGGGGETKSLDEQARERRARVRSIEDFFEEAKAYAKAKAAAISNGASMPEKVPAWEAMLPCLRGELPIVVHADEVRQIRSAVQWAGTNNFKIILAGGLDAWMVAGLLATNRIPVLYEHVFSQPVRDTEPYDVHFKAADVLRRAGVQVLVGIGRDPSFERNLPYAAAQAIAFGLPEAEALKGLTLYPAQLLGVGDRLGSIEPGKDATLFVCDGTIFDLRANVKQMWIAGKEVSLQNRHTQLYEKYKNRPKP